MGAIDAGSILAEVMSAGIQLQVVDGRIRYAPRAALDERPDLKRRLAENREDIIAFISEADAESEPLPIDFCPHCESRDGFRHIEYGAWFCLACGRITTPREFDRLVDPWTLEPRRPAPPTAPEWSPEAKALISWFEAFGRDQTPLEPFRLAPHRRITNPMLWRDQILNDIAAGPGGPRSKTGALISDLRALRAFLEAKGGKS